MVAGDGTVIRRPTPIPYEPLSEGDALVMATSGSTGEPKAVIHTHASVAASATATNSALAVDPSTDRWLACLPLAHIGGLSVVLRSMHSKTPVTIHPRFDAASTTLEGRSGATLVSLVTRALNQIDTSAFRTILIGGAAPPPDRPANTIATYGMTETGSGIVYDQTTIDSAEVTVDDDGQILVRGPMLFRGYRQRTDRVEAQPDGPFVDGWFPTGDFGYVDSEGHLVVQGRGSDVIVTGGEKVWPVPVETVLRARSDIDNVAIVGEPDPSWGHVVVAVITVPGPPPSLESLRQTVKQTLPSWCAPKKVVVRSELPTTSTGKVVRHRIVTTEL